MFDQQHGEIELLANGHHGVAEFVDLGVSESGGRFVHEQEPRPRGQSTGDLEALEGAERQAHGRPEHERPQTQLREEISGPVAQFAVLAGRADAQNRTNEPDLALTVSTYHHVLEQRHGGKQREVLERASDSEVGDLVSRHGQQIFAVEHHGSAGRFVDATDDVEHGGLAGTVGSDQTTDLTGLDGERQTVESDDSSERHRDTGDVQEVLPT